jgi:hypothetical protein
MIIHRVRFILILCASMVILIGSVPAHAQESTSTPAVQAPTDQPSGEPVSSIASDESAPQPAASSGEENAAAEPEQPTQAGLGNARALKSRSVPVPAAAPAEEQPAARLIILPEEKPQPVIDKYAMLSAGFLTEASSEDKIVGAAEEAKVALGYGDVVYVSMREPESVNVGDRFLVYSALRKVKSPVTGEKYGLAKTLGILEITEKNPEEEVLTARITLSFDTITMGDSISPYQEPTLIFKSAEKKTKEISGDVIMINDEKKSGGHMDFAYIDVGKLDGVEPGDQFTVYSKQTTRGGRTFPRKEIGTVQALLVQEHTATVVVKTSTVELEPGNTVVYKP